MQITISLRKTLWLLSVITIALIVLHIGFQAMIHFADFPHWTGLGYRFNMGGETTVPSWYSQALFLIAAGIILIIGALKRQQKAEYSTHWLVLGAIFTYLSIDDGASLHELFSDPVHLLFNLEASLFFVWIIPFAVLVLVFIAAYGRFWLHLPAKTRRLFVLAAAVLVIGALGMELIGYFYTTNHGWGFSYSLLMALEESLEKVATIIFIHALLDYLKSYESRIKFVIAP